MKTVYKYIIAGAILGLLVLLTYKLFWPSPKVSTNNVANIIKLQQDTTIHVKDKHGSIHAESNVITDPNRNLVISMYKDSLDKLATELGIKEKQINQFGTINTELSERLVIATKFVDSSRSAIQVQGGDAYVTISGIVYTKEGTSYLDYSAKDTLNYVFFDKRQNIFQKLTQIPGQTFDVRSKNPKMYISNISSVIIPPAIDSHFKIGGYLGYGATLNTHTTTFTAGPQIGVGLLYKF